MTNKTKNKLKSVITPANSRNKIMPLIPNTTTKIKGKQPRQFKTGFFATSLRFTLLSFKKTSEIRPPPCIRPFILDPSFSNTSYKRLKGYTKKSGPRALPWLVPFLLGRRPKNVPFLYRNDFVAYCYYFGSLCIIYVEGLFLYILQMGVVKYLN